MINPTRRHPARPVAWGLAFLLATLLGPWFAPVAAAQTFPAPLAFVPEPSANAVAVINLTTDAVTTIALPANSVPVAVAVTPNGQTAYVVNQGSDTVTPITVATLALGTPIPAGPSPTALAIAPNGDMAYVADGGSNSAGGVTPINLVTQTAAPELSNASLQEPLGIALTPNGQMAYVTAGQGDTIVPITLASGTIGTPIVVGNMPQAIAITPNGQTAYVGVNGLNNPSRVVPVTLATGAVGSPITAPDINEPDGLAISPNGQTVYVANNGDYGQAVVSIATATNTAGTVFGNPNAIGTLAVAVSPSGSTVYVLNQYSGLQSFTNEQPGTTVSVPSPDTVQIALTPDQGPTAALAVTPAPAGSSTQFSAAGSVAASSPIVSYTWAFGDGATTTTSTDTTTHVYQTAGTYQAQVTVTDANGTSTAVVYTGQAVLRNGSAGATARASVTIAGPVPGPSITTTTLPPATAGAPYHATLSVAGAIPVTWSATTLPAGLSLSTAGVLSGTPATAGSATIIVTATPASGPSSSKTLTLAVNAAPVLGSLSTTTTTGTFYTQTVPISGGTAPFIWSASGLPAWLTLSAAGVLSGTPTTAGSVAFTLQVRDANGATAARPYTVTVNTPAAGQPPTPPPVKAPPAPPTFAAIVARGSGTVRALALAVLRAGWTYWTLLHAAVGALGPAAIPAQHAADTLYYQDHVRVTGPFAGVAGTELPSLLDHPVGYYGAAWIGAQRLADAVHASPLRYPVLLAHPVGTLGIPELAAQRAAAALFYRYGLRL